MGNDGVGFWCFLVYDTLTGVALAVTLLISLQTYGAWFLGTEALAGFHRSLYEIGFHSLGGTAYEFI
jgi:hypothetical protein